MTWARRLKRAFTIDIGTGPACGGAVRIIACIKDRGGGILDGTEPAIHGARFRVSWHPGPAFRGRAFAGSK
jgi:hypothetical protein